MTQDKSSRLSPVQEAARTRTRADVPAPEITVNFSEEEGPTASLPKPLLQTLLRGTLPTAPEPPPETVAVSERAAALVPAAEAPSSVLRALVSEAPHTPPTSRAVPAELESPPSVVVVPATAE